jgi:hypothetical protein
MAAPATTKNGTASKGNDSSDDDMRCATMLAIIGFSRK